MNRRSVVSAVVTSSRHRAFTLAEILVVMAICTVLAALAVPRIERWSQNQEIDQTTSEMVRLIQTARLQAIRNGQTWIISVIGTRMLKILPTDAAGDSMRAHDHTAGRTQLTLPPGFQFVVQTEPSPIGESRAIRFFADGMSSGGQFGIESPDGQRVFLSVHTLTGVVSVLNEQGGR